MAIAWLPKTVLGRWCGWLAIAAIGFFVAANLVVASGQEGGETFTDNLAIAIPMFAAGAAIVAAGVVGGLAVWRGERAAAVLAIIAAAVLVAIFITGEFTVRH